MVEQKHILVIRLSAMGDVAMTVPTIAAVVEKYTNVSITVLTNSKFAPLFSQLKNVEVYGINPKEYKGLRGLFRLCSELNKIQKWVAVVDLHNVIRSKILRWLFYLWGVPSVAIDKERIRRKKLTAREDKEFAPLRSVQSQYMHTFSLIGLAVHEKRYSIFPADTPLEENVIDLVGEKNGKWIGIAPFAQHQGKIYPKEKMEEIIKELSGKKDVMLLLFGNGPKEETVLKEWEQKYPNTLSIANKISLLDELKLMTHLDCILTMDSANMHLASLVHIPIVSVWGQTHPYAGFFGSGQTENHIVQVPLPCRPCSIYGNKECYVGDYPCLNDITPEMVTDKIEKVTATV